MTISEFIKDNIVLLDGSMGTLLQAKGIVGDKHPAFCNLTHPSDIADIHKAYFLAGSNAVYTDTFGISTLMCTKDELDAIIKAAVANARKGAELAKSEGATQPMFVALDIGPTGKLLKPYGDYEFEVIVEKFAEVVRAGVLAGADLIIIETMSDIYETKAALLAAKENSDLPVWVTNSYGSDCKLATGADAKAMVAMLEGMGADAIGVNCSLGPKEVIPIINEYLKYASVPVICKPNAGMPEIVDGKTVYGVSEDDFSSAMVKFISAGGRAVGGCCGSAPSYIESLAKSISGLKPLPLEEKNHTLVGSYTHAVEIGAKKPVIIGERINPTGKKAFKEALYNHDIAYVLGEGVKQVDEGADILDVNVGAPDVDEAKLLPELIQEIQSIINLPLQIDTGNVEAMEASLRCYNGKPLLNSVNGSKQSLESVLPLAKKYGAAVIALTMDENGVPASVEERIEIAKRILDAAKSYGIKKKDIIFDPLVMTVSANNKAAKVTLDTLFRIHSELGARTSLGISNVSFGLPRRDLLNSTFINMALEYGLDAAIYNPGATRMVDDPAARKALLGEDENFEEYIAYALENKAETDKNEIKIDDKDLNLMIRKGIKAKAIDCVRELARVKAPLDIINEEVIPALNTVGEEFAGKKIFLPQLLMSAGCATAVLNEIKTQFPKDESKKGKLIMATVKGDVHDIGKNICKLLVESYGYEVIDLGKDVPIDRIIASISDEIKLIGLSALMTTTLPSMEDSIKTIKEAYPQVKISVGGAVLTSEYAEKIGADYYTKDAMEFVKLVTSLV